ncbi:MAG: hypothetical protein HY778_04910 [Betaproteobacteria bacterium]|nr:hypothetical protein [Betaproteobacteria bacterium]
MGAADVADRVTPEAPVLTDPVACEQWLAAQPRSNPQRMQMLLLEQLDRMNHVAMPATRRFAVLETLRESVLRVQRDSVRGFAGRALPLAALERTVFQTSRALWRAQAVAYQRCVQACLDGDAAMRRDGGRTVERALEAVGNEQVEACLAGYEPRDLRWLALHALWSAAERLGVAGGRVAAAYALPLLMRAASPFELPSRHRQILRDWLESWSQRIQVVRDPPRGEHAGALIVDLASAAAATRRVLPVGDLRWLDCGELAGVVHRRIDALRQGQRPEALGLGDEISGASCKRLLKHLHQHCCGAARKRRETREAVTAGEALLLFGREAVHEFLCGQPFGQPEPHLAAPGPGRRPRPHGWEPERWQVQDISAGGLRLARPVRGVGGRVGSGHLLTARVGAAQNAVLGATRWAMVSQEEDLCIGVQLFPGTPRPVALRLRASRAEHQEAEFHPGFLVPAGADARELRPTLVMPAGWFRRDRVVDIWLDGRIRAVQLTRLTAWGGDFDRAEYGDMDG